MYVCVCVDDGWGTGVLSGRAWITVCHFYMQVDRTVTQENMGSRPPDEQSFISCPCSAAKNIWHVVFINATSIWNSPFQTLSLFYSLSFSTFLTLSILHTHTHTQKLSHTHTYTQTHTGCLKAITSYIHTGTHTHTRTPMLRCIHAKVLMNTLVTHLPCAVLTGTHALTHSLWKSLATRQQQHFSAVRTT